MKLIDMVFIHATSRENSEIWDITTNVTDSVFTSNDVFHILPDVELAVEVEGKVNLAANYTSVFKFDGELGFYGRPEDMRDFNAETDFGMFSYEGNAAVRDVVKQYESKEFTEELFWECWAEVEKLDFTEVSDTAVREAVFRHLEDGS